MADDLRLLILVIEHGPEYEGGVRFHAVSLILLFHAIVVGFIFVCGTGIY